MFVASLNLDLFFKKVFSNKRIAKNFLEDFFSVKISEITILPSELRVSDDATVVKFDFRCKINGRYVVIEMQQKYKTDVNKRFYLYHCVSTALQLETLKSTKVAKLTGETYTEKDYSGLEPVVTLIWMVEDRLNFEDDFIAFSTLPEAAVNFICNTNLWQQPLDSIKIERENALKIIGNATKELNFFSKNRLVYAFQKNIIKNKKNSAYFKWFDFANKSRNFDNEEEDFSQFKSDKTMAEVINRLRKDKLTADEFKYVSDIPQWELFLARKDADHQKKLENQKKRLDKLEKTAIEEKQKAEQEKQKADLLRIKLIKMMIHQGETIQAIADALDLTVEETTLLTLRQ